MAVLKLLGRFFVDDVGEPSCLRLCFFMTVCTVLALWILGCWQAGCYIPLGGNELGLLGLLFGGKIAQSGIENFPQKIPTQQAGDNASGGFLSSPPVTVPASGQPDEGEAEFLPPAPSSLRQPYTVER